MKQFKITKEFVGWHWKKTLTWRWLISWCRWNGRTKLGFHFRRYYQGKAFMTGINTRLGSIWLFTQPKLNI